MRAQAGLLAVLGLAVEPQGGMRPEEAEGAQQQGHHQLVTHPHLRVSREVVGAAVRLEAGEAGRGQGQVLLATVAGLAGLQSVVGVHLGLRLIGLADAMAAMAVVALGGVGIPQRVDLAVVGGLVGGVLVLVAVAAVGGDRQLDRPRRGVAHPVRAVAVGTHGRLGVAFVDRFLAVHRTRVVLDRLFVAVGPAQRRAVQSPLRVSRAVLGRDVEAVRVVAVVATGVGLASVLLAAPCVIGGAIGVDVLDDRAQPGSGRCGLVGLRGVPQLLVAVGAAGASGRSGRIAQVLAAR